MTGFRDTQIQEDIKNVGAKLGTSVSKTHSLFKLKMTIKGQMSFVKGNHYN